MIILYKPSLVINLNITINRNLLTKVINIINIIVNIAIAIVAIVAIIAITMNNDLLLLIIKLELL